MVESVHAKHGLFPHITSAVARFAGRPETVLGACVLVLLWLVSGPFFDFSETWQLVINTGTTIVTFLMVFIIQDSQNRDSAALHLKLDELIRATDAAENEYLDLEELSQAELDRLRAKYVDIAHEGPARRARLAALEAEHKRRSKMRKAPAAR